MLAASSLTDVFGELGRRFNLTRPPAPVRFSFGPSSALVTQLREGAPADVVATADEPTMDRLREADLVEGARAFATNRLAIAVRPGNPAGVRGLADLAGPGLAVVVCAPEVPCGRLAQIALARAGTSLLPRSYEPDVRAVLARVSQGEADAGIVYATDVRTPVGGVEGVALPPEHNVETLYALAAAKFTARLAAATAFIDYVLSPEGQVVLAEAGFGQP